MGQTVGLRRHLASLGAGSTVTGDDTASAGNPGLVLTARENNSSASGNLDNSQEREEHRVLWGSTLPPATLTLPGGVDPGHEHLYIDQGNDGADDTTNKALSRVLRVLRRKSV
jgi:hypothetical protein